MISIDTWLIIRVFQPLVNRAAGWRSHYELAEFFWIGAVVVMLVHIVGMVLSVETLRSLSPVQLGAAVVIILAWIGQVTICRRWAELESHGHVRNPALWMVLTRWTYLIAFAANWVSAIALWWFTTAGLELLFAAAWTLGTAAVYFESCLPGTPRKKSARLPLFARWRYQ